MPILNLSCPVCSSQAIKERRSDRIELSNTFCVCQNCGHGLCSKQAFKESAEAQTKYNQAAFFGASEEDPIPEWFRHSDQICETAALWHLAQFRKFAPGRRFLDIGCGLGGFLKFVKAHSSFECHGNDISRKACSFVEKTWGIPAKCGPFSRELFDDDQFDMIFLSHVIEHIPDPHNFVQNIRAICTPGAIVGIVCPNDASLTATAKRFFFYPNGLTHEYGHLHWPMHLSGFTPHSLDLLFSSEGFTRLLSTTWNKTQNLYGVTLHGKEKLVYPLYFAENIVRRGNMLVAYFQAP